MSGVIPFADDAVKPITQEQAAALVGVTLRHLQRICVGPDAPPKLANAVGRAHGFPCLPFGAWLRAKIKYDLGVGADGEAIDPQREKALLDRARRITVETEHRTRIGELLESSVVAETWANQINIAKTALLGLPAKLAHELAATSDPVKVAEIMRERIRETLIQLAGDDGNAA